MKFCLLSNKICSKIHAQYPNEYKLKEQVLLLHQLTLEELRADRSPKDEEENRRNMRIFQGFLTKYFGEWASGEFKS